MSNKNPIILLPIKIEKKNSRGFNENLKCLKQDYIDNGNQFSKIGVELLKNVSYIEIDNYFLDILNEIREKENLDLGTYRGCIFILCHYLSKAYDENGRMKSKDKVMSLMSVRKANLNESLKFLLKYNFILVANSYSTRYGICCDFAINFYPSVLIEEKSFKEYSQNKLSEIEKSKIFNSELFKNTITGFDKNNLVSSYRKKKKPDRDVSKIYIRDLYKNFSINNMEYHLNFLSVSQNNGNLDFNLIVKNVDYETVFGEKTDSINYLVANIDESNAILSGENLEAYKKNIYEVKINKNALLMSLKSSDEYSEYLEGVDTFDDLEFVEGNRKISNIFYSTKYLYTLKPNSNRIYHGMCYMPKKYRSFLQFPNQQHYQIDLTNSFWFCILQINEIKIENSLRDIFLNGTIYEELGEKIYGYTKNQVTNDPNIRKKIKGIANSFLSTRIDKQQNKFNSWINNKVTVYMKKYYPTFFYSIKAYKNKKSLSIELMKIETNTILPTVIANNGINIHDAIIVGEDRVDNVCNSLSNAGFLYGEKEIFGTKYDLINSVHKCCS